MGVQIAELLPKKEVELEDLSGRKIAIDAFNTLYQFLSIIRDRFTGEPLKDSRGRITSHLSGLFYRTVNMMEAGIKPVFVFDGKPPAFKHGTIEARMENRQEALKKWKEAVAKGEPGIKYAQASSRLTPEMVDESKKLLDYMGIPYLQAPSEGEAQCAYMCNNGDVFAAGSQDSDSLLFGSPRLVRNISVGGRKKLPGKEVYVNVKPQVIELKDVLSSLGLTREQLIMMGMLVGTDYNPGGVHGFGPKKSLETIRGCRTLDDMLSKVKWETDVPAKDIMDFFLSPPVIETYDTSSKSPDIQKLTKFLVDEHSFSVDRIEKFTNRLSESFSKGKQSSLGGWLKK